MHDSGYQRYLRLVPSCTILPNWPAKHTSRRHGGPRWSFSERETRFFPRPNLCKGLPQGILWQSISLSRDWSNSMMTHIYPWTIPENIVRACTECPVIVPIHQNHGRAGLCDSSCRASNYPIYPLQLWPWLPVITGDFYGIIHSINGVISTYNW